MGSVTFKCATCGMEDTLSDPLMREDTDTTGWKCHRCHEDMAEEIKKSDRGGRYGS